MRGLVVGAILALVAVPAGAQTLSEPVPGLLGGAVERVHVDLRQGTPVVALVMALPAGSVADPPGSEGAAQVLADAIARTVEDALGLAVGRAEARVEPYRTYLTVLVETGRWTDAWAALEAAAFDRGPTEAAIAETVATLDAALLFQTGSPALDVEAETRTLLFGAGSSAARPPGGTREGILGLTGTSLSDFRRGQYRRSEAALAVVGNVSRADVQRVLGVDPAPEPEPLPSPDSASVADSFAAPADTTAPAMPEPVAAGPPTFSGETPWETGDRVRIAQEVTSTWIAVAWPAPDDLPPTLLEFLAHRIEEELTPVPPDPGLYSVRVEATRLPRGRILLVEAAVLPEASDRWESRILDALDGLRTPIDEEFFLWQRRRFRAAALLREATPELSALRRAEDLLATGAVRTVRDALWRLDPVTLASGASALGAPRILVYGPDLGGN